MDHTMMAFWKAQFTFGNDLMIATNLPSIYNSYKLLYSELAVALVTWAGKDLPGPHRGVRTVHILELVVEEWEVYDLVVVAEEHEGAVLVPAQTLGVEVSRPRAVAVEDCLASWTYALYLSWPITWTRNTYESITFILLIVKSAITNLSWLVGPFPMRNMFIQGVEIKLYHRGVY